MLSSRPFAARHNQISARFGDLGGDGHPMKGLFILGHVDDPVGHDDAFENRTSQRSMSSISPPVFRCVNAAEQVVGGHQGVGLGFSLHTDAKALQVNFPHGPFADDAVAAVAVFLLIVGGVVFDGGAAARMTLHAFGNGGGCLSEIRGSS